MYPQARRAQPQTQPAPETPETTEPRAEERAVGGRVVRLHTAHPRVTIPYLTPGDVFSTVRSAAPLVPSPRKLAFYGILGGMAVVGALEWPIAVAVGLATEVVTREQSASREREESERRRQATEEGADRAETPRPAESAAR